MVITVQEMSDITSRDRATRLAAIKGSSTKLKNLLLKEPIDVEILAGIADYDGSIDKAKATGKGQRARGKGQRAKGKGQRATARGKGTGNGQRQRTQTRAQH